MRRRGPRHDDEGATLILVLIIITVLATVMGVILSQEDTAIRSTDALRDQAADVYGADGATQAVLNGVKTSGIDCSNPTNPTGVTLGSTATPFYVPTSSQQGPINAYAQCTPDPIQGASTTVSTSTPPPTTTVNTVTPAPVTSTSAYLGGGDPTRPSYGLLTTGSTTNDFGIDFSGSASNKTICVQDGSVASDKDIDLYGSAQRSGITLAVQLDTATSHVGGAACGDGSGVAPDGSHLIVTAAGQCIASSAGGFKPTACTAGAAQLAAPAAPAVPSTAVSDNPAPKCLTVSSSQTTYAAFVPGRYTSVTTLNAPCASPAKYLFEWFSPGAYYFDFGTTPWAWPDRLLAGTPMTSSGTAVTGLNPNTASTLGNLANAAIDTTSNANPQPLLPTACDDPANSSTAQGVELVFGGASTVNANSSGSAVVCATSSSTAPPPAIYGLANAISVNTVGGGTVSIPAETLCSPATGCGTTSLINTDSNGQPIIYFKGYVYAPNAQIILTLKNSPGQVFNWGIVVRNFRLSINGSSPVAPFIQLPKPNTAVGVTVTTSTPPPYPSTTVSTPAPVVSTSTTYTIRYINVWTCTVGSLQSSGQSRCPSNGTANVQVRVLTNGSSMQVLSWNTLH